MCGRFATGNLADPAWADATRHLHPRTPVFVEPGDWERWLTLAADAHDLMRPPPDAPVRVTRASPQANSVRNDGPELLEHVEG